MSLAFLSANGTPAEAQRPDVQELFPDAAFRAYLLENYDTNADGTFSDAEKAAVTRIACSNMPVSSLQGIEHFSNLQTIVCDSCRISSIDVSRNFALKRLSCMNNRLRSTRCLPKCQFGAALCLKQ